MEFDICGLQFSSKFDSGNLARAESVVQTTNGPYGVTDSTNKLKSEKTSLFTSNNASGNVSIHDLHVDHDVKLWTRSDCEKSDYENGNRTWFHFSVRGYAPGKLIRMTIMNMNKQAKVYSQGYAPLYKVHNEATNITR